MQKHKLPLPSDTFLEYLTNPDSVKKKTYEFGKINKTERGIIKDEKNNRKKRIKLLIIKKKKRFPEKIQRKSNIF